MALTGKQRKFLRAVAHPLAPVVRIGRGGVSGAVIAETIKSLAAHELVKVRIGVDDAAERQVLAEELAVAADAHIAGSVGKIAILYRARDEKPAIKLPS